MVNNQTSAWEVQSAVLSLSFWCKLFKSCSFLNDLQVEELLRTEGRVTVNEGAVNQFLKAPLKCHRCV